MKLGWKLLLTSVAIFLLLVLLRWLFALVLILQNMGSSVICAQLVDYFGLPTTLYMKNVSCLACNNFRAPYVIQPPQGYYCTADNPIFLMILVASRPENFERRKAIRHSWGSVFAHREYSIRTVFVSGLTRNSTAQNLLEGEANRWHDVLQVGIDDNYKSLTNKSIASAMWAVGYCGRHFTFLLKTDDDSFNVPQRIVEYLVSLGYNNEDNFAFVGGLCSSGEVPHRFHKHRWFVPHSSYPLPVFPLHAKGRGYVLSNPAALQIVSVSNDVLFNTMEDVFVTGICRAMSGIPCTNLPQIPRMNEQITDCDLVSGQVFNVHYVTSLHRMESLWNLVNTKSASEQDCGSKTSTLYVVIVSAGLLSILYYFTVRKRSRSALLLPVE